MSTTSRPLLRSTRAPKLIDTLTRPLYWLYERQLLQTVQAQQRLPKHIGIIMDGNRRFARSIGLDVRTGHNYGADKAREVLDWCLELGIPHVTLWGFSKDNRNRTADEVTHLHQLFAEQARELIGDERLHRNRVRVQIIGELGDFPEESREALREMEEATRDYGGMRLNVALGYGGREEIVTAIRNLLAEKQRQGVALEELARTLDAGEIGRHLYTAGMPDPDFVIRTSGEVRLSGFLLWQTAYSEFYFCDAFWPSFRKIDFLRALRHFQARERRFGR
ncbi:MAG: polyprenyl diphosphate synthase [Truepera sp.]|nr:polyprenyl diphosphate synthase [Truepera sp.]